MKMYKPLSFAGAVLFAVCGLYFLILPNRVYLFFNIISRSLGMPRMPVKDIDFFYIYTIGYLYIMAALSFLMFRNPESRHFPVLLANGSFAVSILSIAMFLIHKPYLIYGASLIANGIIGALAISGSAKMKKRSHKGQVSGSLPDMPISEQ
ncbi:MAG: hypothetical protein ACYSR9_15700 [Planctomycetota bacterium]